MRSPWSVGILMVAMGGLGVAGPERPGPVGWAVAGGLIVAGAALFLKRPFTFWLGLAAATLLTLTGVLGFTGQRELGLPVHPGLAVGVGLYLCLRMAIARPALTGPPKPPDPGERA